MPGLIFLFVAAENSERLTFLGNALQGLGAAYGGPQAFALIKGTTTLGAIRDALGELNEGECIYLISAEKGNLENHLFVRGQTDGGVSTG